MTVEQRRLKRGADYTAAELPGRILSGTIRVRPRDPSEGFSVLLR